MQPGALYLPQGAAAQLTGNGTATVLAASLGDLRLPGEAETVFDARAVTLAVYNGTDQEIVASGLQLLLSDAHVPGAVISYTAANPAIASGTAATVLVPLASGILASLAVTVSFAAGPANGRTAQVRATVHGPGSPATQLTGSLARVSLAGALIGSVGYAAIGTSYNLLMPAVFNRAAQWRVIMLQNNLNESPASLYGVSYDSLYGPQVTEYQGSQALPIPGSGLNERVAASMSSGDQAFLPLDSLSLQINCSTAPTSGSLEVYAWEVV